MIKKNAIFSSIFLINFTTLFAEILLTRIFSVTLGYHFTFFVISLTMFGLSLGGTYLFIFRKNILKIAEDKVLYVAFLLIPLSFLLIIFTVPKISFSFYFGPRAYLLALILFLICQLPFFFVGFLMSYLFMQLNKESGKVYFFDLIGAGAGASIPVLLINYFGPINSLIFLGIVSSTALVLNSNHKKKSSIVVLSSFIILLLMNYQFNHIGITEAKGKKMNNLFVKWNSCSMVRVFGDENSSEPDGGNEWGMSSVYQGLYSPKLNMEIDANAYSPIIKFNGDFGKVEFLKYDVISFAYHLYNSPNVLIIGPGGGRDVLSALIFGSKKIVGVEINPIIANDIMKERFKSYSGDLYCLGNVEIIVDDARSYIRNSKSRYDIIQASLVDTWAATSAGAYSLSENNLYTVEAMAEYINHLTPSGYLTISRWYGADSYKLTVLYLEAAKKLMIKNARKHIVLIKSGNIVNHIFKKSEFSNAEIKKISQLADEMKFEILYMSNVRSKSEYTQIIYNKKLNNTRPYFYLKASTDDSPFFFNKIQFRAVPGVLLGITKDVGIFLLYGLFIISSVLSLILIVVPLYLNKKDLFEKEAKSKFLYLIYFSLLGIAFMLMEISFVQKFMIFLGLPIYSTTVVIFSILVFSGIGSFFTNKIAENKLKSHLKIILLVIIGIILCYNLSLYPLFNKLLGIGIKIRILISIFLLSVMGFFIGMPFPIGMKLLGLKYKGLIPFCWSLNGIFSVLGSILAVILAMNIGFTKTIFLAASLYFIAFMILCLMKTKFILLDKKGLG